MFLKHSITTRKLCAQTSATTLKSHHWLVRTSTCLNFTICTHYNSISALKWTSRVLLQLNRAPHGLLRYALTPTVAAKGCCRSSTVHVPMPAPYMWEVHHYHHHRHHQQQQGHGQHQLQQAILRFFAIHLRKGAKKKGPNVDQHICLLANEKSAKGCSVFHSNTPRYNTIAFSRIQLVGLLF